MTRFPIKIAALLFNFCLLIVYPSYSQPEVTAWGNMTGIRVEGQLTKFESSFKIVGASWHHNTQTAKEQHHYSFKREGSKQIITSKIGAIDYTETVEDIGKGKALVNIQYTSTLDTVVVGTFFSVIFNGDYFADGAIEIIEPSKIPLGQSALSDVNEILRAEAKGIKIKSKRGEYQFICNDNSQIIVKRLNGTSIELLIALANDSIKKNQTVSKTFTITTNQEIDKSTVEMLVDVSKPGRVFDGIGGNFRLQNAKTDPQVIDYCLENLRVAYARVEMPWQLWHADENVDPTNAANAGKLNDRVKKAMELAQRMKKMDIPIILSGWFAPDWAIVGERTSGPQLGGLWGNPLNHDKMDKIYKSITDYILYMKDHYGVEVEMFSFNESDLGIDIRQTGLEHRDLIKNLGAYFKAKGLKTKLLLGDTSDANSWAFLNESLADPSTWPFIGAVSFHSWRGWEYETLKKWADAAEKINKPLVVGEGSIDAAAHQYPSIFEEQIYAIEEINLYVRMLAICQPKTILQWQLTADYSPLAGGGIFGNNETLRPTRRFWQLKQLSATPKSLPALAIACASEDVSCAALGNPKSNQYAFHIVNNGASREAIISGIPKKVKKLKVFVTDKEKGMEEVGSVAVMDGKVTFTLPEVSYVTLMNSK